MIADIAAHTTIELRQLFRRKDELFSTLILPALLMVLIGSVIGGEIEGTGVSFAQYMFAGIVGLSTMAVGFVSVGGQIAGDKVLGTLKRYAGTPMRPIVYIGGKVGYVVVVATVQLAILFAVGIAMFEVEPPADVGRWVLFAAIYVGGLVAFALVGIAFSQVITDVRSVGAVMAPPYVALPFVSGVYFFFSDMPGWMQALGSIFPLRWIALGIRSTLLPDAFATVEPGGTWQRPMVAAMLIGWAVVGLAVSLKAFRWRRLD